MQSVEVRVLLAGGRWAVETAQGEQLRFPNRGDAVDHAQRLAKEFDYATVVYYSPSGQPTEDPE